MTEYWLTTHRDYALWLGEQGYIPAEGKPTDNLQIAWSDRLGMEFTTLEFFPWVNRRGVACVEAIVGHHASGTNPRLAIGTCEDLSEVAAVHHLIRRLNGYPHAAPDSPEPS